MQEKHFEVILEDINSKLSTVTEGLQVLDNKIEKVDKKLDSNIKELRDEMVVRFDYLDRKIDSVHDKLDKKIDNTRVELKHEIRQIHKVTENHEERLTNVEAKVVNL